MMMIMKRNFIIIILYGHRDHLPMLTISLLVLLSSTIRMFTPKYFQSTAIYVDATSMLTYHGNRPNYLNTLMQFNGPTTTSRTITTKFKPLKTYSPLMIEQHKKSLLSSSSSSSLLPSQLSSPSRFKIIHPKIMMKQQFTSLNPLAKSSTILNPSKLLIDFNQEHRSFNKPFIQSGSPSYGQKYVHGAESNIYDEKISMNSQPNHQQQQQRSKTILVESYEQIPLNLVFRSLSSHLNLIQEHQNPQENDQKFYQLQKQEEPIKMVLNITKPIIQEIHEMILPYRNIRQQIHPVQEYIETTVMDQRKLIEADAEKQYHQDRHNNDDDNERKSQTLNNENRMNNGMDSSSRKMENIVYNDHGSFHHRQNAAPLLKQQPLMNDKSAQIKQYVDHIRQKHRQQQQLQNTVTIISITIWMIE
ncbi:uncharacterized protein LOC113797790 [Dermatophagoides pteronyssinus]|uniref:uncharacterized protein LOC113797790 n=1 Tax=Dermatophagoides pteronyssinus TaxID=6956 RepID=UPI003F678ED0